MKHRIFVGLLFSCALMLIPSAAFAKGVTEVTVTGKALPAPIEVTDQRSANQLADESGFYTAVFGEKNLLHARAPHGKLGPRYVATYRLLVGPGQTAPIRQELYPFARNGPVTYTPAHQRLSGDGESFGGWYHAHTSLAEVLVAAGVPSRSFKG